MLYNFIHITIRWGQKRGMITEKIIYKSIKIYRIEKIF